MAQTYRVQIRERIIHSIQQSVFGYLATTTNDLIEFVYVSLAEPHGQAELMHAASRTAGFEGADIDRGGR